MELVFSRKILEKAVNFKSYENSFIGSRVFPRGYT